MNEWKLPFIKMPRISSHISVLLAWQRWDLIGVPHLSGRKTNCQCWKVYHQRKPYCWDDKSFHAFLRDEIVAFRIYPHNLLISWEISRFRISHQQQLKEQEVIIINDEKLSTRMEKKIMETQRSIRLLTINFDIVEDKPWRWCTYLDSKKRIEIEKFDTFSFFAFSVDCEAFVPDIHMFPRRFWALNQFSVANCLGIGNQLSIGYRPNRFVFQRWEVLNRLHHFFSAPKRPEKQS